MEFFSKRRLIDFNNKIKKVFNLLTLSGKYKVIGSSSIKSILYNSDYDLDEKFKDKSISHLDHIYNLFKEKFKKAEMNPDIFITDFKCGEINGEPIRWSKSDMYKGYKNINGKKVTFQECLLMKSTVKLDIIALINGMFTEFSENYYLKIGNYSNFNKDEVNKKDILDSLKASFDEYYNDGDYLKSLKRIYAYLSLENPKKNRAKLIQLIKFFNSTVGIINKAKSDIDTLMLVLEDKYGFRKPKLEDIFNNLQIIKQNLSYVFNANLKGVSEKIDKICNLKTSSSVMQELKKLRESLFREINKITLDYILKNKNLLI